jgi:hypothetical protein
MLIGIVALAQFRSPHGAKRNAGTTGIIDPGFRYAPSGLRLLTNR